MPGPASCPGPAGQGRGLPAAGRVPIRRAGILAGLGAAYGGAGRAAGRGPDRVRDDPGTAASRARAAARAVLPAARPGPGRSTVAGTAGLRHRRHDHDRRRQRGEPGRLLQAAWWRQRRRQLPDAAPAGPGQLWHPHRHRHRVRPCPGRRDHLLPEPARQPARGNDPAPRPELRRRLPGRADHGNQGRLPDPRPGREHRPQAPRPEPLPGRVLAVAFRRPRPGHRRRDHRHHQHRACHRRLPADHHPDRRGPLPRRRPGCSLPRALGSRDGLFRAQVRDPRRPGPARASPTGSARRSTPCWSPTRPCAPPSPTPPAPSPAPTPTAPASPSP